MRGDNLGAVGDADYAISLNPKAAVVYYIRGLVFSRLGLWPNASDDFAVASRLDPSFRRGLADYSLGWALMAQGHYSDAIVSFTKAIARSPLPAPSYFQRSRAYEQLGDIDAAISDMNVSFAPFRSTWRHIIAAPICSCANAFTAQH